MNEVSYESEYDGADMWWYDDGSWWEDQSWLETSQVWDGSWDESWDNAWNEGQDAWTESWSWPAIEDQKPESGAGGTAQGVQSLVLSPLISEVFAEFSTGLFVTTEIASECSHFSATETIFETSTRGLQCLDGNRVFCNCANCVVIGEKFGEALEAGQLTNVRLQMFFRSLPPACCISESEFFEEPEVIFVDSDTDSQTDSACSFVFDQPTNFGDELDDSSGDETNVETCQLWNLDFGWIKDPLHDDSSLLCGMFSEGTAERSGTTQPVMHPQETFDCGLQGPEVEGDDALSNSLVCPTRHRIRLQKSRSVNIFERA